jgi:hypothetical protein
MNADGRRYFTLIALFALLGAAASSMQAPFIETFQRNGKTLIYVLSVHHSPVLFPDAMADPVFKTIQSVLLKTPPDAVILEGVDPSQISGFLEYARQCAAANYNLAGRACDENAFTAYSAAAAGAQAYTGEPSASASLSVFRGHGYSIQDFFAFWIMNNIPQEKRHGTLSEDKFRQLVDRVVGYENRLLGTPTSFTTEDFAAWYAKNMRTPHNYLDIAQEDTSPNPSPGSTLLHTLSALSTRARDENIVATIKTALENHSRVLVVYGASHFGLEREELVRLMGMPKKTKPF